jgi:hypothetical protein
MTADELHVCFGKELAELLLKYDAALFLNEFGQVDFEVTES